MIEKLKKEYVGHSLVTNYNSCRRDTVVNVPAQKLVTSLEDVIDKLNEVVDVINETSFPKLMETLGQVKQSADSAFQKGVGAAEFYRLECEEVAKYYTQKGIEDERRRAKRRKYQGEGMGS